MKIKYYLLIVYFINKFAYAFTSKPNTIDAIDRSRDLSYNIFMVVIGIGIIAAGCLGAWMIWTGAQEGIMRNVIKLIAGGCLAFAAFYFAPSFFNFCI